MGNYDMEESEAQAGEVPDSLLRRQGGRKFSDRRGLPFILIGIGLVVLIILASWLMPEAEKQPPVETSLPAARPAAVELNTAALSEMESRLAEMETRMAHHQSQIIERLDQVQGRLDDAENRIKDIGGRLDELGARTRTIADQLKTAQDHKQTVTPKAPKAGPANAGRQYTVEKGDTLYSIARNHGISLSKLLEINSLGKNAVIHPGDKLRVTP